MRKQKDESGVIAVAGAVVAGVALVAWGVSSLFSGPKEGKIMRAPGRPGEYIPRDAFEADPSKYFTELRKKF